MGDRRPVSVGGIMDRAVQRIFAGFLVVFGLLLILVGCLNWFIPDRRVASRVEERVGVAKVLEEGPDSSASERVSGGAMPAAAGTPAPPETGETNRESSTTVGEKFIRSQPSDTTTVTIDSGGSRRSESVTIALLGFGFVLVLVGALFPRISSITLPGGAGIALTDSAEKVDERLTKLNDVVSRLVPKVELLLRDAGERRSREGRR